MKRLLFLCLVLVLLFALQEKIVLADPTPTPTPATPTPSPTPTCEPPLLVYNVTNASISPTRAGEAFGWYYHFADDNLTYNFGLIYDNQNVFSSGMGLSPTALPLRIKAWSFQTDVKINQGDYLAVTFSQESTGGSSQTAGFHFDTATSSTAFYVGQNFKLYDAAGRCTQISVSSPTPTPTPATTPTPTAPPAPTATPTPTPRPTPSPIPSPSPTPTPRPSPTPTSTPTPTPIPTVVPPTPTPTPVPSPSPFYAYSEGVRIDLVASFATNTTADSLINFTDVALNRQFLIDQMYHFQITDISWSAQSTLLGSVTWSISTGPLIDSVYLNGGGNSPLKQFVPPKSGPRGGDVPVVNIKGSSTGSVFVGGRVKQVPR